MLETTHRALVLVIALFSHSDLFRISGFGFNPPRFPSENSPIYTLDISPPL